MGKSNTLNKRVLVVFWSLLVFCALMPKVHADVSENGIEVEVIDPPEDPNNDDLFDKDLLEKATELGQEVVKGIAKALEGIGSVLPDSWNEQLGSALDRINIKFGLGAELEFSKVNVISGALGIRYERNLEPSFRENWTTVYDRYFLPRLGLSTYSLSEILRENKEGFAFGASTQSELQFTFARQFEGHTWQEHLLMAIKWPYDPVNHLPTTAERILEKLKVGDFVAIQTKMNILANLNQFKMLTGQIPVSAGAFYGLTGEYMLHLYKLTEQKVRLKIIAVREQGGGVAAALGFKVDSDQQFFKVSVIDSQLRKRLSFAPLQFSVQVTDANLAMVDYVLDLSSKDVRDAYKKVVRSLARPKMLKVINPFRSDDSLKQALLVDISPLEDLFERDRDKSGDDKKVDREFRGTNDAKNNTQFKFKIGYSNILQFVFGSNFVENQVLATDRAGNHRYFLMPTYSKLDGFNAVFGLYDSEEIRSASLLFETDPKWNPFYFGELAFHLDLRDKYFRVSEADKIRHHLKKRLPREIYNQIQWGAWAESKDRVNARVTTLLIFKAEALDAIDVRRVFDRKEILAYMMAQEKIESLPDSNLPGCGPDSGHSAYNMETKFWCDLTLIQENLSIAFDSTVDARRRIDAFSALRSNPLWSEIGPGYMVTMLDKSKPLEDLIYFETIWQGRNMDPLTFSFGNCKNRSFYRSINYIVSIMNNRTSNIQLLDESAFPEIPNKDNQCKK